MKMAMIYHSTPHTEEFTWPSSVVNVFDLCTDVFVVTSEEPWTHKVKVIYPILIARKQLWQDWQLRFNNICTLTKQPVKE